MTCKRLSNASVAIYFGSADGWLCIPCDLIHAINFLPFHSGTGHGLRDILLRNENEKHIAKESQQVESEPNAYWAEPSIRPMCGKSSLHFSSNRPFVRLSVFLFVRLIKSSAAERLPG